MRSTKGRAGTKPLAQNYTVAATAPADSAEAYWFFICTGFAILPDGTLMAAGSLPIVGPEVVGPDGSRDCPVMMTRSDDHGATWKETARLPFSRRMEVALYARGSTVYLFAAPDGKEGVLLAAASEDKGVTWSQPVAVIRRVVQELRAGSTEVAKGAGWEIPTEASVKEDHWLCSNQGAMVEKDGRLYLALGERCQTMAVAVCELAKGILEPGAWRMTGNVEMPIPKELNPGLLTGPSMRCLEGNVIQIKGRLRVLARAVIDRYSTCGLAAVFDLKDDGEKAALEFTQFYPVPGGQGKFHIVHDEGSRLFWMASNLPANSQGWVESPAGMPMGNDRRFLMLWYSCDALNWFPAGCIARMEKLTESFMYPLMIIDGDDLAILVRTSLRYTGLQTENRVKNGFHDANLLTFHRVRNFRSLAMNIWPTI